MAFDLTKAIRDRQEREALRKAVAFTREGANDFRPVPDQLVGFHDLQLRFLTAIEAGADNYTDGLSILGALLTNVAGMMGYAVASLPMSYGADARSYWEEAAKRAMRT